MAGLIVTIAGWGDRKKLSYGGIYVLSLDDQRVICKKEYPREEGATRVCGGCAIDETHKRIFVAREVSNQSSIIEVIDLKTFERLAIINHPNFYDVHQIAYAYDLLWVVNTNRTQVVVFDGMTFTVRGIWDPFPSLPAENTKLEAFEEICNGDKRKRIHMNSIAVHDDFFYITHFGIDNGSFLSPQGTKVQWRIQSNEIKFHSVEHCSIQGLIYPHNCILYKNSMIVCDSGRGIVLVDGKKIDIGGWPRGVALNENKVYIGVSFKPSEIANDLDEMDIPHIAILDLDTNMIEIINLVSILGKQPGSKCQVYEVRYSADF